MNEVEIQKARLTASIPKLSCVYVAISAPVHHITNVKAPNHHPLPLFELFTVHRGLSPKITSYQ